MFVEAGTVLEIAADALKHQRWILRQLRRLRYLIRHGRLEVVIFGPGGTGKTTLGKLLTENFNVSASPARYAESIEVERFSLPGDLVGEIIVAPGQGRRRERYWPDLYRGVASGKSVGVINVVSWGYHSFEDLSYTELESYRPGMSPVEFLEAYLPDRRAVELEVIRELAPHLATAKGRLWMVTLVAKQDLWWKRRTEVREHYTRQEYDAQIQEIRRKLGEQQFTHEYLSASLVSSNFATDRGELLAPTAEGYDQNIQLANLQRLVKTVQTLAQGLK